MSLSETIKIFTHVGDDPRTGGGVAAYVKNLSAIMEKSGKHFDVICLSRISILSMFVAFLRYYHCRQTVLLNSAIHPFSILMILFSHSQNLIVMPHGELLNTALEINKTRKKIVLKILKYILTFIGASRNLKFVITNEAERANVTRFFSVKDIQIVQSVFNQSEQHISFQRKVHIHNNPLHVVMIGRMVRMKGFKKVLDELAFSGFDQIQKVSLYYLNEDAVYLIEVQKAAEKLKLKGIEVALLTGRNADQIFTECADTNAILIMPSDFEAFGYVLVENLWMPNKPIVSFKNPLTTYLSELGHCNIVRDNQFSAAIQSTQAIDRSAVNAAIRSLTKEVNERTINILFRNDV